ncbi:MAG: tetratricopeptide repeat protein [Planctomycetes bacterium]|jgi:Tfp pilus assembly protein PilF|nr:tetratricopeptide repeat protein [Planctomycetota bacterium]
MRWSVLGICLAALLPGCLTDEETPEEREASFYTNNAQAYIDGGHYERALQQFDRALEIDEDNQLALVGRAWTYVMLGEAQILRGVKAGAENIQLALAEFEELEGDDFGPASYKIDLGYGKAHLLMAELYERRADLLRSAVERRPDPQKEAARSAADESRLEHYREATTYLARVLEAKDNPLAKDDLTALLLMARINVGRQDYAGALIYTERYLEQVRRSKSLWLDAIRKYPSDEKLYEAKLAGAVAKEVPARYLISSALFKLGRVENAETELNEVLLLDPFVAGAWLDRGIVREQLGKNEEAIRDYREFLTHAARLGLTEDDPRVVEAAARIANLTTRPPERTDAR